MGTAIEPANAVLLDPARVTTTLADGATVEAIGCRYNLIFFETRVIDNEIEMHIVARIALTATALINLRQHINCPLENWHVCSH